MGNYTVASQYTTETTEQKGSWIKIKMIQSHGLLNQFKINNQGFPGDAVVKNPPANAGDTGSSPGPGRSHMPQSN